MEITTIGPKTKIDSMAHWIPDNGHYVLETMSKQQVFDAIAIHLLHQLQKCTKPDNISRTTNNTCFSYVNKLTHRLYRSAAAIFIPRADLVSNQQLYQDTTWDLLVAATIVPNKYADLISAVDTKVHQQCDVDNWGQALLDLANSYNLYTRPWGMMDKPPGYR